MGEERYNISRAVLPISIPTIWNILKKYISLQARMVIDEIIENEEADVCRDFRIQPEKYLPHNSPELTTVNKKGKKVWMVHVAAE